MGAQDEEASENHDKLPGLHVRTDTWKHQFNFEIKAKHPSAPIGVHEALLAMGGK